MKQVNKKEHITFRFIALNGYATALLISDIQKDYNKEIQGSNSLKLSGDDRFVVSLLDKVLFRRYFARAF
jgi:hypothetical protein